MSQRRNKLTMLLHPKDGKLPPSEKARLIDMLGWMVSQFEGKVLQLTIEKFIALRSNKQNRFYFGVYIPIAQQMFLEENEEALTEDEMHEWLKKHVLLWKREIKAPDGTTEWVTVSSRTKTTEEWEKGMEVIRAWGAAFKWFFPLPNEGMESALQFVNGARMLEPPTIEGEVVHGTEVEG